jgi:hypothetical protein
MSGACAVIQKEIGQLLQGENRHVAIAKIYEKSRKAYVSVPPSQQNASLGSDWRRDLV